MFLSPFLLGKLPEIANCILRIQILMKNTEEFLQIHSPAQLFVFLGVFSSKPVENKSN